MRGRQSIPVRCWFLAAIPPSAQLNQNRGKGHRLYGQVVSWTQARLSLLIWSGRLNRFNHHDFMALAYMFSPKLTVVPEPACLQCHA